MSDYQQKESLTCYGDLMHSAFQEMKALFGVIGFNNLSTDQREVTFYSEGSSYWPHLEKLLTTTLEQSDKSVCYVSSSLDDPGLAVEHPKLHTFFIGMGFVRDFFFQNVDTGVMVMTMPDLQNFQVKRSRCKVHYLYVQHSLSSLHMIYQHGAFDYYDTICAAGPHHVTEIRAIEKLYNLPKKEVIELGYSRLDNLKKIAETKFIYKKKKKKEKKCFLIAPSWGPQCIIECGLGKSLVSQLLTLGHEVILRPHPQTIKFSKNMVDEIKMEHKDNPRFTFESSVAGQDSLHWSDIMVSDWSGAALEYALALQKIVIFCDVPRKVNNPNYNDIKCEPLEVSIREKVGVVWNGVTSIQEVIKLCEQITGHDPQQLMFQHVFNCGHSDDIFVDVIERLNFDRFTS